MQPNPAKEWPRGVATPKGLNSKSEQGQNSSEPKTAQREMPGKPFIRVRFAETGEPRTFNGRQAWALAQLIERGAEGVTPIERPTGPRWSAYVLLLRRAGLLIETIHLKHGGPYPGTHGCYVLKTPLEVLDRDGV